MPEKLLSKAGVEEKKRILTEEYGMIMTTELEIISFGYTEGELAEVDSLLCANA